MMACAHTAWMLGNHLCGAQGYNHEVLGHTCLRVKARSNAIASPRQKLRYEHITAAAAVRAPEYFLVSAGQARQQVLLHKAVRQSI
jgi:hypothetical protein